MKGGGDNEGKSDNNYMKETVDKEKDEREKRETEGEAEEES